MLDRTVTQFSHVKPNDTEFRSDGLRDFFIYRDLGIAEATAGKVLAQRVRANNAPEKDTGWHRHEAELRIVLMLNGWAKFMFEDKETLLSAGDCVHQRPGIAHYLFDYSRTWSTWKSSVRRISPLSTCQRPPRCPRPNLGRSAS